MSAKNMATTMKGKDNSKSGQSRSSASNSDSNSEDDSASQYESSQDASVNNSSHGRGSSQSGSGKSKSGKSHSVSNGSNSKRSKSGNSKSENSKNSKSEKSKNSKSEKSNSIESYSAGTPSEVSDNEPAVPQHSSHPNWPQQEGDFTAKGWYNNLVIPAARSWVWCQQSHYHALDLYRSSAQGEKAFQVKQTYKDNKARYGFLRKEVNPRRVNGNHWERFTLHASELYKIGDRYGQAFRRGIDTLQSLHGDGFSFCEETFAADIEFMGGYVAHQDYLFSLHSNAMTNYGETGAERSEIANARKFLWASWAKVQDQFKCAIKNNKDDPEALEVLKNSRKAIKTEFIQKNAHHSVRCLLRMLVQRTTWTHVFLPATGNEISERCANHIATS